MDTKLALDLDKQRFEEQASANHKEMVAGVVAGAMQCVQGCVQAVSSGWSIHKNRQLGLETQKSTHFNKETAEAKIALDGDLKTQKAITSKYNQIDNEITIMRAKKDPTEKDALADLEKTQKDLLPELKKANDKVDESTKTYNRLSAQSESHSKYIDQQTNLERFKDQLRSNIIQAVKGAADVGIAFVRYEASEDKRKADMLEAAKNTTDRSANAMSESGKKAAEEVKNLLQRFDSLLQMLHATAQKANSA
jgi:hypothetical protein